MTHNIAIKRYCDKKIFSRHRLILAKSEKYSDELSEQTLVEEMDEMDGNGCS